MTFESSLDVLSDPDQRISSQQLVDFSNLDTDENQRFAELWPSLDSGRRLGFVSELTDLAQDNVELNFDAVFKTALGDEEPVVRGAAVRGLYEYEGTDLIPVLADTLRSDPDAEVRREAAIALGRFALAAELGYLRDSDIEAVKEVLIESAEDLDEDERVRARAIEALGAISGEDTENLIESIFREESLWLKVDERAQVAGFVENVLAQVGILRGQIRQRFADFGTLHSHGRLSACIGAEGGGYFLGGHG